MVPTQEAMVSSVNDDLSGQVATKISGKFSGYMAVKQFLDPNDELFRIRMNSDLIHVLAVKEKPKENGISSKVDVYLSARSCVKKDESTAVIQKCQSRIG
jgi:hypothetical protein